MPCADCAKLGVDLVIAQARVEYLEREIKRIQKHVTMSKQIIAHADKLIEEMKIMNGGQ